VYSSVVSYDGARNVRDEECSLNSKPGWKPWQPPPKRRTIVPEWSGFRGKTTWDWLVFLAPLYVTATIALLAGFYTQSQTAAQLDAEAQRAAATALQTYLDQMNQHLLENNLRQSKPGSEVRTLARAQTLTVLETLDPERKTQVLRFLVEAELVQGMEAGGPIIIPSRGVDTRTPVISLSQANLQEIDLGGTQLQVADLSNANLRDSTLIDADLRAANLTAANLTNANLGTGADPSSGTFLSGADLTLANLSNTNLRGAQGTTKDQLDRAATLRDATMPNGQKYEDWLKSKNREEGEENDSSS
jgi:uncharacterized protein YjbI with pentapeptide repeats